MQETTTFSALQAQRLANEANHTSKSCQLILTQIKLAAAEGRYQVVLQLDTHQVHWLQQQSYSVVQAGIGIYNIKWN